MIELKETADFWDKHLVIEKKVNPFYKKFIDFAIPFECIGRNLRVLDVGCGNGNLSIYLAERCGFDVTGIDISEKSIEFARTQNLSKKVTFVVGDIIDTDLYGPFDIVIGAALLHEIPEERFVSLAQKLNNLLTNSGYGVFFENSFFNPAYRLIRAIIPRKWRLGHDLEYPFDPRRYHILQQYFPYTRRSCVVFILLERFYAQFLSKLIDYPSIYKLCNDIDYLMIRLLPHSIALFLSYVQVISFSKANILDKVLNYNIINRPWMPDYKPEVTKLYNGRAEIENRIKEGKSTQHRDKTSCQRFEASHARLKMGIQASNLLHMIQ